MKGKERVMSMSELKIKIPESFSKKLADTEWEIIVKQTISNVQPFLDRGPMFFREYTIHGTYHINNVIENAEQLIPDSIIADDTLLKAKDVGILLCSIIIHDLGMFIDDSQFVNFLKKDKQKIDGIKPDMSNLELWEDFCHKAKRFSAERWNNLSGISDKKLPDLLDAGEWTTRDHLVIGEFLRCYHHRFAFEIAMHDFMGVEILPTSPSMSMRSKNLIGLIAYSHCIGIRDIEIEEYCNAYFGSADYVDDCPLYYLIALLRLGDYLDVGVERAPKAISNVHAFYSETSKKQWLLNQIFSYKSLGWRSAKRTRSLDLPAEPKSTTEFVTAEKMLLDIQKEFDSSVAVLEEMYHGQYSLTVSRITSNILKSKSRDTFAKRFFLNDTRLHASPAILPLLVGPLYANDPAYGVRELIQNAVDACRQREFFEQDYKGKIIINIDTCKKIFLIEDNGVGMNEDIVSNYYLKAGSSYRSSEEWRKEFIDDFGKTRVIRIGRFGIGALATFLIGDKATVSTLRIKNTYGCKFTYTLNADESIDVTCGESMPTGTSIKIEMSENACLYFRNKENQHYWSKWYRYENPEIDIILDGKKLINDNILPSAFKDEDGWYRYNSKLFSKFIWSYEGRYSKSGVNQHFRSELICSGIPVGEIESPYHMNKDPWSYTHWSILRGYGFDIHLPLISLDDNEGCISLDLSRSIVSEIPLEETFIEEIYKYLIAELLTDEQFSYKCTVWESRHGYIPIAHSGMGYTILARSFILHTGKSIWCFIGDRNPIDVEIPIGYLSKFNSFHSADSIHYDIEQGFFGKVFLNGDLLMEGNTFTKCCGGIICKKSKISHYIHNKVALSKFYGKDFEDICVLYPNGRNFTKKDVNTMATLSAYLETDDMRFLEYIPTPVKEGENNLMLKMLQKYIPVDRNGGWIPYEIEKRKSLYPEAFEELSGYMHKI